MKSLDKKLRGAIIGFGNIAEQIHWPAFLNSKNVEIVAIVDISEQRRLYLKTNFPNLTIYNKCKDLLSSEKLDFIDIATPPTRTPKLFWQPQRRVFTSFARNQLSPI